MKRLKPFLIGGLGLILVLLIGTTVFAAPLQATGCFSDTNGHWAETFICFAEEYGIVGGYPDGTFRPENNVTRAEAAVMFQNTLKVLRGEGRYFGTNKGLLQFAGTSVISGETDQFNEVTIEVPSRGALLINGYLNLDCIGGTGPTLCLESNGQVYFRIDGSYSGRQQYHLDGGSPSDSAKNYANISMSTYYVVLAGSHTIDMEVDNDGPSTTWVKSGGMNVLFVPFDGTGAVAVSAEE